MGALGLHTPSENLPMKIGKICPPKGSRRRSCLPVPSILNRAMAVIVGVYPFKLQRFADVFLLGMGF